MEVRNCKRCNKIFKYFGNSVCPECREAEEAEYKLVKDYLWDHPGANMHLVSEATGVSTEKILRYLREERLQVTGENSVTFLDCVICGSSIRTGRYCEKCSKNAQSEIQKERNEVSSRLNSGYSRDRGRMHVADRIKNRGRNR